MKRLFNFETGFVKKLAFTLAEVIIVMGVIGIVAEMTIPSLVRDTQKVEAITRLKKITSMLNQAILLNQSENYELAALTNVDATDTEAVRAYFAPRLRVAKSCLNSEADCGLTDIKCLHKRDSGLSLAASKPRYILADGTAIGFNGRLGGLYKHMIYVDVNGPQKPPNVMGVDVFVIFLLPPNASGKPTTVQMYLIDLPSLKSDPSGCDDYPYDDNGMYCYYRVVIENWQINYWPS